jgi:hypothetical protein
MPPPARATPHWLSCSPPVCPSLCHHHPSPSLITHQSSPLTHHPALSASHLLGSVASPASLPVATWKYSEHGAGTPHLNPNLTLTPNTLTRQSGHSGQLLELAGEIPSTEWDLTTRSPTRSQLQPPWTPTSQPPNQPASQPVSQSASQPVSQPASQPARRKKYWCPGVAG